MRHRKHQALLKGFTHLTAPLRGDEIGERGKRGF